MNTLRTTSFQFGNQESISSLDWVSVKNQLPPYGVDVLVFLDFHNQTLIAQRTSTDANGEHWSCDYMKYVTHWMYLPVPPIRKVV
jgi:hypothetical protein